MVSSEKNPKIVLIWIVLEAIGLVVSQFFHLSISLQTLCFFLPFPSKFEVFENFEFWILTKEKASFSLIQIGGKIKSKH